MKTKKISSFRDRLVCYNYLAQRLTVGREWSGQKNIEGLFREVGLNPKWDNDKKLYKLYGIIKRDTIKQLGVFGEYVLSEFLKPVHSAFIYPEWSDGLYDAINGVYALTDALMSVLDEAFDYDEKIFKYRLKIIEHKGSGTSEKYNPDWLCRFIYEQKEYVYQNYFDGIPYGGINTKRFTEWLEER